MRAASGSTHSSQPHQEASLGRIVTNQCRGCKKISVPYEAGSGKRQATDGRFGVSDTCRLAQDPSHLGSRISRLIGCGGTPRGSERPYLVSRRPYLSDFSPSWWTEEGLPRFARNDMVWPVARVSRLGGVLRSTGHEPRVTGHIWGASVVSSKRFYASTGPPDPLFSTGRRYSWWDHGLWMQKSYRSVKYSLDQIHRSKYHSQRMQDSAAGAGWSGGRVSVI